MFVATWGEVLARAGAWLLLSATVLALSGCTARGPGVFADRLYLDTSREPCGHKGRRVEILQDPPSRPYSRVAYVESFAAFYADEQVDWEDLRNELCHQASEVGADAIIEMTVDGRPYSRLVQLVGVEVSTGGNTKKLTGIAIRYNDASP